MWLHSELLRTTAVLYRKYNEKTNLKLKEKSGDNEQFFASKKLTIEIQRGTWESKQNVEVQTCLFVFVLPLPGLTGCTQSPVLSEGKRAMTGYVILQQKKLN